ncbi:acyltransferase domain-containing protein [Roseomonas gilardii]|uniref:acyltransferase domain-containing protein n=1 Tax=Roseomonas gilardii TaxID=257708 RepID=UPI0004877984|nr:acyltransferase domain-containing protein [Roseomonas gilardii]SUE62602.1 Malonyl CoA-acyl carrier protein transacylase [Roseomonas gilardii subsp. rosea]
MTLALLCPGQGTQHAGMFALTGAAPEAAPVFAAATALLGEDPRHLVQRADAATLHGNRMAQILCGTQQLAAFLALRGALGGRLILAGYSLGEVSAWGCAGLLPPERVLPLIARRAAAMDDAGTPGQGLAYIRGLERQRVEALCAEHGAALAIVNPGLLHVVGGLDTALDTLCDAARAAGALRAEPLPVHVASHTHFLAGAVAPFRTAIGEAQPAKRPAPGCRLLSGIDAAPVLDGAQGAEKLAAQLARTIEWAACLQACAEAGASAFLELGPGRALAAMAAEACPGIPARSLEDFRSLDGVRHWLAGFAV